ncbi:Aste57867_19062 [Aphanomyces stellatus]|uniref:Aste57867_19062 protein n=1 Tax=Aphanomyces stellatus TaxID=120398 RepID=A0A485LD53_9STRA|nr:hypothetical protein As57867_018998 [Aphanomyces stellatus]VFT95787.1 Aste57867_19062 [Aphanomyces stellatus]
MKVPDEALLRSRSKAPLDQVHVLYLCGCSLDGVANIASCAQLHSVYLQQNRLMDLSGLAPLRNLWHVNLAQNPKLHDLTPLAEFSALGFLSLEHCDVTFDDLAVLRDTHLIDLRLAGNPALVDDDSLAVYRLKTAALLPNLWTLDGHYITHDHRLVAHEQFGTFVALVTEHSTDRFGATAATWRVMDRPNRHAAHVADVVAHQPTQRLLRESYRLKALLDLYAGLASHFHANVNLAPPKAKAMTTEAWPRVAIASLLHLPPRARLNLAILLAARLDFPSIPAFVLSDALTINLLGHMDASDVAAVLDAPPYVATGLLFLLGEQSHVDNLSLPENDRKLWASLPVVFSAFVASAAPRDDDMLFARRCCYAVILLSRSPNFPAIASDASTVTNAVYVALLPLLEKAKMRIQDMFPDGSNGGGPSSWMGCQRKIDGILGGKPSQLPWNNAAPGADDQRDANLSRRYDRPWASTSALPTVADAADEPTTDLTSCDDNDVSSPPPNRSVKPGEWVQVRPRQFVPVVRVSATHVVLATFKGQDDAPWHGSSVITLDRLVRTSANVWKLIASSSKSSKATAPLHRQPHGYHKLGVPRDVGVPNLELSASDVAQASTQHASPLNKSVQLFSANAAAHANYVLAPQQIVHAQNYWMEKLHPETNQAWSHIAAAAPAFEAQGVVVQPRPLGPVRHVANALLAMAVKEDEGEPEASDDSDADHGEDGLSEMMKLQRDMASLLGKPMDATIEDVPFFVTTGGGSGAPPPDPGDAGASAKHKTGKQRPRAFDIAPDELAALHQAAAPARKAGYRPW